MCCNIALYVWCVCDIALYVVVLHVVEEEEEEKEEEDEEERRALRHLKQGPNLKGVGKKHIIVVQINCSMGIHISSSFASSHRA